MPNRNGTQDPRDKNYNNEITRKIDSQPVIAPQYGIVGKAPTLDPDQPPSGPHKPRQNAAGRSKLKTKPYVVHRERTKDLKLDIALLEQFVHMAQTGAMQVKSAIRQAMEQRLDLMREEKIRRDLRDLATGRQHHPGSFHSLGARLRVA